MRRKNGGRPTVLFFWLQTGTIEKQRPGDEERPTVWFCFWLSSLIKSGTTFLPPSHQVWVVGFIMGLLHSHISYVWQRPNLWGEREGIISWNGVVWKMMGVRVRDQTVLRSILPWGRERVFDSQGRYYQSEYTPTKRPRLWFSFFPRMQSNLSCHPKQAPAHAAIMNATTKTTLTDPGWLERTDWLRWSWEHG
jgi:hypothetical protein